MQQHIGLLIFLYGQSHSNTFTLVHDLLHTGFAEHRALPALRTDHTSVYLNLYLSCLAPVLHPYLQCLPMLTYCFFPVFILCTRSHQYVCTSLPACVSTVITGLNCVITAWYVCSH